MIKCVLVVNNTGKPRLMRFFYDCPLDQQQVIMKTVYNQVSQRSDETCCCFAENEEIFGMGSKIIYRHFATLYFIFVCDDAESELGILDLVQVFVQVLDSCFENVCELDLIYHFDKVNYILDELVMGGMVLETSVDAILNAINGTKKFESEAQNFFGITT